MRLGCQTRPEDSLCIGETLQSDSCIQHFSLLFFPNLHPSATFYGLESVGTHDYEISLPLESTRYHIYYK